MMLNPGESLLKWWKTAGPRARWFAGILLFSLLSTAILIVISDSPTADGLYSSSGVDSTPWYLLSVFVKLLVVIGLFVGSVIIYRYYAKKQPFRKTLQQLEIVETVRLTPRQAMHLVRAGDRLLLVGATDQAIALITEIDANNHLQENNQLPAQAVPFEKILASLDAMPK